MLIRLILDFLGKLTSSVILFKKKKQNYKNVHISSKISRGNQIGLQILRQSHLALILSKLVVLYS